MNDALNFDIVSRGKLDIFAMTNDGPRLVINQLARPLLQVRAPLLSRHQSHTLQVWLFHAHIRVFDLF